MLQITSHRQGAILNHNHGKETADALEIEIAGFCDAGNPVRVNGVPAVVKGRNFTARVKLTQRINAVTATMLTPYGDYSQTLTLVWDKASYPRYNFFIDDHSFFYTDLSKSRPKSVFDHFYFKGLREIHQRYGTVFTLNTFFHDDHHDCYLTSMPDIWKSEFQDNADWLTFSFHAYSEFPDRPYAETTTEKVSAEWDAVQNEIIRFAGEECYLPPVCLHWENIHPNATAEYIRRGATCYCNACRLHPLDEAFNTKILQGSLDKNVKDNTLNDLNAGLQLHYGFQEEYEYVQEHGVYYDPLLKLFFFRQWITVNLVPLDEIGPMYMEFHKRNLACGNEVDCACSHEQYTFSDYSQYLPDHMQRLDRTAQIMTECGYKPCFYSKGLLGNEAWDK